MTPRCKRKLIVRKARLDMAFEQLSQIRGVELIPLIHAVDEHLNFLRIQAQAE